MGKLTILDEKTFTVGRRKVHVQRQDEAGADKPHQVRIRHVMKGITMTETSSYPPGAVGNRDFHYIDFDQAKAEKIVARTSKFLTTKPGKKLVGEEATK